MLHTNLFNVIENNTVIENQHDARLLATGSTHWRRHTNSYGKFWHGVTAFGAPSITASLEDGWMLYALVKAIKPKLALEIGSNQGFSTCMIAAALVENDRGELWTIDTEMSHLEAVADNLDHYGLSNHVKLYQGRATDILNTILPNMQNEFEFVFEDASHNADEIIAELKLLAPYLSDETYLVFHDSILLSNVAYALTQVESIVGPCQHVTVGTCRGLDVWQKIYVEG